MAVSNTAAFLSTPSARRATRRGRLGSCRGGDFYPRPPRGGRHRVVVLSNVDVRISIHALREEGDESSRMFSTLSLSFLSTPSARRATRFSHGGVSAAGHFYPRPPRGGRHPTRVLAAAERAISIHALREEGDHVGAAFAAESGNFYPRPPRGGRQSSSEGGGQSKSISIHALREEGDQGNTAALSVTTIFLSTPSARRATCSA